MVLTNFELWAADGSSCPTLPLDYESNSLHTRHLNPFDPRVVPQLNSNLNHLSSNGYYGFSYVNASHDNNNNDNNTSNINQNNNNNNDSTTYNFMANDVNGMNNTFTEQQALASSVNIGSSAYAAGYTVRCKKRFYVTNDEAAVDCTATNDNKNYYSNDCEVSAKRCRFDDDSSAQYCNDFFQLPSTQIATQSCLMETEEGFENNNNHNIEKYGQKFNPQLQNLTAEHHQQQQHNQQQLHSQQQQQQPQQTHLYHQQQHYQDIQFATIKCHLNYSKNNSCDTIALNNHTYKTDLGKNTENVLKNHNTNLKNSIERADDEYDNDIANNFKVDDATLFAQLHGGCLHHHDHYNFNSTITSSGEQTFKKDAVNHHLQNENDYEEF